MIRLATANDADAIATVLLQAFLEYKTLYTDGGFAATALTSHQVLERINEGPVWVTISNDGVVGTAAAMIKGDSLYIRGMAVLPAARGQRAGELLLERIENYAAAHGCRRLFLSTTPFLDRAIRLYQRWGFTRTREGPNELFGTPLFTMEKVLRKD